jgi:hypothetical protein
MPALLELLLIVVKTPADAQIVKSELTNVPNSVFKCVVSSDQCGEGLASELNCKVANLFGIRRAELITEITSLLDELEALQK